MTAEIGRHDRHRQKTPPKANRELWPPPYHISSGMGGISYTAGPRHGGGHGGSLEGTAGGGRGRAGRPEGRKGDLRQGANRPPASPVPCNSGEKGAPRGRYLGEAVHNFTSVRCANTVIALAAASRCSLVQGGPNLRPHSLRNASAVSRGAPSDSAAAAI